MSLADVCNDSGNKILSKALTGNEYFQPISSWSNQERQSKYSWQVWCQCLRKHFATKVPKNTKLDQD
eukprot:1005916-Ditylum_brightwellii.AAC.1